MSLLDIQINSAGYQDQKGVIKDVRFTISKGEIVGLIGENGAGKSTTIKSILGLLEEIDGEIQFYDNDTQYAYIPEHPVYYDDLTLWEHLELVASVLELDRIYFEEKANQLLQTFHMEEYIHQFPKSFSKGMQQKLVVIIAFLINPDVYIIDEPFIGLDPMAIKDFIQLIQEEKQKGKGILMSTHVLDTAEKICDRLIIINHGTVALQGTLEDIRNHVGIEDISLLDSFYQIIGRNYDANS